jgi:hypothetical protein
MISRQRARLNGMAIGSTLSEVRQELGSPNGTQTTYEEALGQSMLSWIYQGYRVSFLGGKVVAIHCDRSTCITTDGVRVGATRAEIDQIYGLPGAPEILPDASQVSYEFQDDNSCVMLFTLSAERLAAIDVSCALN